MNSSEPKVTEQFRVWMERRYPKIWASKQQNDLGDNELWLYDAVREAYHEAYTQGVADTVASLSSQEPAKDTDHGQQRVQQAPQPGPEAVIEQRIGEFNPNHGLEWP